MDRPVEACECSFTVPLIIPPVSDISLTVRKSVHTLTMPPAVFPPTGILFSVGEGDGPVSVDPVAVPLPGISGAVGKRENPLTVKCSGPPVPDVGPGGEAQGALSAGKAIFPFPFIGDIIGMGKRSPAMGNTVFPFTLIPERTIQMA